VYSLAQDPATVKRARELLPGLLELGGQSYAVLDTAAVVYLRSGQYDEAKRFMGQALAKVKKEDYLESEVSMNAAELALRSGDLPEARRRLDALRRNPNLPRALDIGVRSLMDELVERERKRPR
jgi:uncharacterized protein HemY